MEYPKNETKTHNWKNEYELTFWILFVFLFDWHRAQEKALMFYRTMISFFLAILQTTIQLTSKSMRKVGKLLQIGFRTLRWLFCNTYLKLLYHLTTCAFVFLSNLMSGKLYSMTLLSGYLVHKNINFAFLKWIGDNSELW